MKKGLKRLYVDQDRIIFQKMKDEVPHYSSVWCNRYHLTIVSYKVLHLPSPSSQNLSLSPKVAFWNDFQWWYLNLKYIPKVTLVIFYIILGILFQRRYICFGLRCKKHDKSTWDKFRTKVAMSWIIYASNHLRCITSACKNWIHLYYSKLLSLS